MSSNKQTSPLKKTSSTFKKEPSNKNRFKLVISYQGYNYQGWQKQKHTNHTIQEAIEIALNKIFQKKICIYGAGRTDAGTHAYGQAAHLDLPTSIPENFPLQKALNALLPPDILIRQVIKVPDHFHALYSVQKKYYFYLILNHHLPCVFKKNLTYWYPYKIDIKKLNAMAEIIAKQKDFKSFQTAGTPVKSTIRKIHSAYWKKQKTSILAFHIQGEGFLKQMIRNLVGTQLALLKHKEPIQQLKKIFSARDRKQALGTAPAHGLYLYKVQYPKEFEQLKRN